MPQVGDADPRTRALHVNNGIPASGLYGPALLDSDGSRVPWRLAPEPFPMLPPSIARLEELGRHLLAFYRAANQLYLASMRGNQPAWITGYLDQGKPDHVVELGRLRRFRSAVPVVIRPDLMTVGPGQFVATELDSVPGGIGLLDSLMLRYRELGFNLAGDVSGIVSTMARALIAQAGTANPFVAVVVSDESESYRSEMTWVGERLNQFGVRAITVHPRQLDLSGGRIVVNFDGRLEEVDLIYRFFEMHDLKNVPNSDLIVHAMKKRRVVVTPPFKAQLEEKLLYALFHHPDLEQFWARELSAESLDVLREAIPATWVVDPADIPPQVGIFPPLVTAGRPIRRWDDLAGITQRERELVIKPSGFSELSWGSRGVTVGHDVNAKAWSEAVGQALAGFQHTPYVLQHYRQSRRVGCSYYDFESDSVLEFDARTRISPYYFVIGDTTELAGVLVTACPSSSKVLHGMTDAVMVPAMADAGAEI